MAPPWSGVSDVLDDGGTFRRQLAAGATDVLIDITALYGLAACRVLAIKTSQTITWKANSSGNTPLSIKPIGFGALDGVMYITTDGITSLYLSNPGSLVAEVTVSIAGTVP